MNRITFHVSNSHLQQASSLFQQALLCLKNRLSRSPYAPLVNMSASDNQLSLCLRRCFNDIFHSNERDTADTIWICTVPVAATSRLFVLLLTSNYAWRYASEKLKPSVVCCIEHTNNNNLNNSRYHRVNNSNNHD